MQFGLIIASIQCYLLISHSTNIVMILTYYEISVANIVQLLLQLVKEIFNHMHNISNVLNSGLIRIM